MPKHRNVLGKVRKLLHVGQMRKSDVVATIRERYPLAPAGSANKVMHWFIRQLKPDPLLSNPAAKVGANSPEFLSSFAWRKLRMDVLERRGRRCECCGASPADGKTVIHVDHIKPRKFFPHLALDINNLQVLCGECNHGKGNYYRTDWRHESASDTVPITVTIESKPFDPMKPRLVNRSKPA